MAQFRLTRKAAEGLYSAPGSLIVSADVANSCLKAVPKPLAAFVLHPTGLVAHPSETVSRDAGEGTPFVGLPTGLMAIVTSKHPRPSLADFLAYAEAQNPAIMPQVLKVPRIGVWAKIKLRQFLSKRLAAQFGADRAQLGQLQQQLVQLRAQNEQLWLGFEKARRMIVGIGYRTRTISFDIAPGAHNVGICDDANRHSYSQILPVDLASFSGISLFVRSLGDACDGKLSLVVRRRSDQAVVAAVDVPYEHFKEGWHHFSLPHAVGRTFGDGVLQLEWLGAGGPQFALADEVADRFGNGKAESLAMRIERGLTEPSPAEQTPVAESKLVRTRIRPDMLREQGHYLGGLEAEQQRTSELGTDVLMIDPDNRWLQIHALPHGIAGFLVPSGLGTRSSHVSAQLTIGHSIAAPCVAMLIAGVDGAITVDAVEALVADYADSAMPNTGQAHGLQWVAQPVKQGSTEHLSLRFDEPLSAAQDLLLAVLPLIPGRADRSWCRWHDITIAQDLPLDEEPSQPSAEQRLTVEKCKAYIRAHRFPELADQLTYYKGSQGHIDQRERLGFWPIEFSDDTGAMQLNPIEGGICAAVLGNGLPENTRRVACEIGTAHKLADPFIYVMGTFPKDLDIDATITDIAASVSKGTLDGSTENGVRWAAKTVSALQKRTLELRFDELVTAENELFFAVLPSAEGGTGYGWCRWYMLAFETLAADGIVTPLEIPQLQEVAQ